MRVYAFAKRPCTRALAKWACTRAHEGLLDEKKRGGRARGRGRVRCQVVLTNDTVRAPPSRVGNVCTPRWVHLRMSHLADLPHILFAYALLVRAHRTARCCRGEGPRMVVWAAPRRMPSQTQRCRSHSPWTGWVAPPSLTSLQVPLRSQQHAHTHTHTRGGRACVSACLCRCMSSDKSLGTRSP